MARGIFLTCCSPRSSAPKVSLPSICSYTAADTQMPPGLAIDSERAADGFDRAREFRQEPVAGQLEDASAMVPHQRLGGGHTVAEEAERVFLVARRHGAEANDVDVHDRGQAPDEVGFSHVGQASREVPD